MYASLTEFRLQHNEVNFSVDLVVMDKTAKEKSVTYDCTLFSECMQIVVGTIVNVPSQVGAWYSGLLQ